MDEGAKALATRQKHIQLTDHSEYGWATVKYYEDDPLAANSDDEKSIKKVEKEAQREIEKKVSVKKRKAFTTYRRPRVNLYPTEQPGPSSRRDVGQTPATSYQNRPRMLGPCFRYGAFGHLAASCTAKERPYSFCQPVVSSAEPAHRLLETNTSVVKGAVLSANFKQKGVDKSMIKIADPVMYDDQPMTSEAPAVVAGSKVSRKTLVLILGT